MPTQHQQHSGQLIITRSKAHTPDDDNPITKESVGFVVKGISVSTDGPVAIQTLNVGTQTPDAAVTMELKAGVLYPIRPYLILDTGTTVTTVILHG